jgi:hypothetical protein
MGRVFRRDPPPGRGARGQLEDTRLRHQPSILTWVTNWSRKFVVHPFSTRGGGLVFRS